MFPWEVSLLLFGYVLADCPPGSKYDSYFNKCYHFFPYPLPFLAAEQKCNSIGGHLADIQNAFENFYVAGEGGASNFWIGANLLLSSNWTWSSSSPMTFTNWANGQPLNSNPCAYVKDSDHTWGTLPCNTQLPFICTISPNATQAGACPSQSPPPTCPTSECPSDSYCSNGYTLYSGNCMCYKYFNSTYLTFPGANDSCTRDGGMLATVPSEDVNDFLTVLPGFNTYSFNVPWIGLTCQQYELNTCTWTDGSPLGNYSNFYSYYPGYFSLISVVSPRNGLDGKWISHSYLGSTNLSYICQKDSIRGELPLKSENSYSEANCPPGSKFDSYFNKCYQFFPSPLPFLAAEQKCNSTGGHLVDIQNAFENFYVAGDGGASNFWIGANLLLSSNWTWSSSSPMVFTNWANGQPVNSNPCAYVKDSDHTWGTLPCYTQLPFICDVNPNSSIPGFCPSPSASTCPSQPPSSPSGPVIDPSEENCTNGYTFFSGNGMCYKYFTDVRPFSDANSTCAKEGGMLAIVTSQELNDFLTALPSIPCRGSTCPFIGLSCTTNDANSCYWVDGSRLSGYQHFYWIMGTGFYGFYILPTDDYVIGQYGMWEHVTTSQTFLCQKDAVKFEV